MKTIFGQNKLLKEFADRGLCLVFDYDGTLTPIVSHSKKAHLSKKTRALLRTLITLYPCAVLTGRDLKDLRPKVRGLPFQCLVGNHGIEFEDDPAIKSLKNLVLKWRKVITQAIERKRLDPRGLFIEIKSVSLSLDYRNCPNPKRSAKQILELTKKLPRVRVVGGKMIYNLLPDVHRDKGTAIAGIKKRLSCDYVLYAGDDLTDEDVFRLKNKKRMIDIHVGSGKRSRARYFMSDQREMDELLKTLVELRSPESAKATKLLKK